MLITYHQDECDKFLYTINTRDKSIYKLNKNLLLESLENQLLNGPNGMAFSANHRAEILIVTYESQFSPNPVPHLSEVSETVHTLNSTPITNCSFTNLGTILKITQRFPGRKAPGEDTISNAALKNLRKMPFSF